MSTQVAEYTTELQEWRQKIDEVLRADWIPLAGRFELQPGQSRLGSDPSSDVLLPEGSAPAQVGVLTLTNGQVSLTLEPGVRVNLNGAPAEGTITLRSDAAGTPDIVTLGALTFFIIQRGPRTIVRLRDANNPTLQHFHGRRWFPTDDSYVVEGVFTPYDPPKLLEITNILGDTSTPTSPGIVTFTLHGQAYQLDATHWRDGGLLLHFRDETNGKTTYGGGRSVITTPPVDHVVLIDFNRTSNLPCAFTEYATCPLPPPQNRLNVAIEAGELRPE